jgi:hypothetical protein
MNLFFAQGIFAQILMFECIEKVKWMQMHKLKISNVTPYIQELYLMTKIKYKFSSNCTICGCVEP